MPRPFTILFAEDETAVRDIVIQILSERGFRVFAARNGYEALHILAEHPVDLLFTDIIMAGMDGVQLATLAKLLCPGLKLLFATGYAPRDAEREAMRLGKLLVKPVRRADMIREIEALLIGPA